jgi:hypothetical protein
VNLSALQVAELRQPELCASLRIIAKDSAKIGQFDRAVLLQAADELELAYREFLTAHAALSEARARQTAMADRIVALTPVAPWSVKTTINARWP